MFDGTILNEVPPENTRCQNPTDRAMLLTAIRRTLLVAAITLAAILAAAIADPTAFAAYATAALLC